MKREFQVGEFAEEIPWTHEAYGLIHTSEPCRHAVPDTEADALYERIGLKPHRVPHLITAFNEGGHNCVQLCLDCVLDAVGLVAK